ncbi:MAG: hypothetical protein ACK4QP_21325 [Pseudorhizobium sp.]
MNLDICRTELVEPGASKLLPKSESAIFVEVREVHMTADERGAIFERVVDRMNAHGRTFETNVRFRAAVDEWIEGHITIRELQAVYSDFTRSRRQRLLTDDSTASNTTGANKDVEVEQASDDRPLS